MLPYYKYYILVCSVSYVSAYSKPLYFISNVSDNQFDLHCANTDLDATERPRSEGGIQQLKYRDGYKLQPYHRSTERSSPEADPYQVNQDAIHEFLFGPRPEDPSMHQNMVDKMTINVDDDSSSEEYNDDHLLLLPTGNVLRAELFNNKSGVHLPTAEFIHRGHSRLNITSDYMQTALNAFAILLEGNLDDVQALPAHYVLHSARTIAMMRITTEKFAALWTVVKGGKRTVEITYNELELYRPLFKYVNGREMARLNLSDDRILAYVGTHAELDRHQMGVVASKYILMNPLWSESKYLNLMNNLLCGVPMNFMRRVSSDVYLQLTHQVFYHIRACDPLQRRFYLAMMTRTEALGKSYSWSARDVSRLGLLLAEVEAADLGAINPEAMSGLTAQVMMEIPAHNLQYLTEVQLRYLGLKPLNILARKLKIYQDKLRMYSNAHMHTVCTGIFVFISLSLKL